MPHESDFTPQFLAASDVLRIANFGRTTLWRLVRDGEFPKPVRIGGLTRWSKAAVDKWVRDTTATAEDAA